MVGVVLGCVCGVCVCVCGVWCVVLQCGVCGVGINEVRSLFTVYDNHRSAHNFQSRSPRKFGVSQSRLVRSFSRNVETGRQQIVPAFLAGKRFN